MTTTDAANNPAIPAGDAANSSAASVLPNEVADDERRRELCQRLMDAIEGECDGLAITQEQASSILAYLQYGLKLGDAERYAARYEYLRDRPLGAISHGGVFAGMTPDNVVLNGKNLDRAIDSAMLKADAEIEAECNTWPWNRSAPIADANEMAFALRRIHSVVVGGMFPAWASPEATTTTRGKIADICEAALAGRADPAYDKSVVKRIATQMGWTPPGAAPAPGQVLSDEQRTKVRDAIAEAIGGSAYDCMRVWSAWGVGTMGSDDFAPVVEDDDRMNEITDAAIAALLAAPAAPAPKPDGESEWMCRRCNTPMSKNPHPDAGKADGDRYMEVGCHYECVACLTHTRSTWAARALRAEVRIRELEAAPAPAAQAGEKTLSDTLTAQLDDLASDMAYEANCEGDQEKASRALLIEKGARALAARQHQSGEAGAAWWNTCNYQTLFDAIAAATNGQAKGIVGVSVIEFRKAMDRAALRSQPATEGGKS